ncbi:hypothetical protein DLAC_01631 [Tieghemostelium lacteum]|uniref:FNIP repeat-containing protein n=1 Tax=Tieghemostelium lacteum TaxID=361077 RepID=A0A152A5Y1_TIELA|nr:hypothetical protein DLAC_01631 [Tieghemostelium lacteum]|eukprot:KYR01630.1 hypothetical protein DLAC_01631 [Tieghemostelium lacteum]
MFKYCTKKNIKISNSNRLVNNFFLLNEISKHLDNNRDIINLVRTCKSSYSFRNQLRYRRFPSKSFYRNDDIVTYKIPSKFNSIELNDHQYQLLSDQAVIARLNIPTWILDKEVKALKKQLPMNMVHCELDGIQSTFKVGVFKEGLKSLRIGNYFKSILGNIGIFPESLTELTFGREFNRPFENGMLPPYLRKLVVGPYYRHALTNLPETLEVLGIGCYQIIKGDIPSSVKHLIIGGGVKELSPDVLPSSLTRLDIDTRYSNVDLKVWSIPSSVTRLEFKPSLSNSVYNRLTRIGVIPNSIREFYWDFNGNHTIEYNGLPNSIQIMTINTHNWSLTIPKLPVSIEDLTVRCDNIHTHFLPEKLKKLTIWFSRGGAFHGPMPDSIEHLVLKSDTFYTCGITESIIPKYLKTLVIEGGAIYKPLPSKLPSTLTSMTLPNMSGGTCLFAVNDLPPNLTSLTLTRQGLVVEYVSGSLFDFAPRSLKYLSIDDRVHTPYISTKYKVERFLSTKTSKTNDLIYFKIVSLFGFISMILSSSTYTFKNRIRWFNFPIYYCKRVADEYEEEIQNRSIWSKCADLYYRVTLKDKNVVEQTNPIEIFQHLPKYFRSLNMDITHYQIYTKYLESLPLDITKISCSIYSHRKQFTGFKVTNDTIKSISIYGAIDLDHFNVPLKIEYLYIHQPFYSGPIMSVLNNLVTLIIPNYFGNIVEGDLPASLVKLEIGAIENEITSDRVIPRGLKSLAIKYTRNNKMLRTGVLPNGLEYLKIDYQNQFEEGVLPDSIKTLIFTNYDNLVRNLPKNLETLVLSEYECTAIIDLHSLPLSLKSLTLNIKSGPLKEHCLPDSLTYLNVRYLPGSLGKAVLPKNLKKLDLDKFSGDVYLPDSLTHYTISYNIGQLTKPLPPSLKYIKFGNDYNSIIDDYILPESLEEMVFDYLYNQPLPNLPKQLKSLSFGSSYNHPLRKGLLPESLEKLVLGLRFGQPVKNIHLSQNLKYLTLPYGYRVDIDKLCPYHSTVNIVYR